MFDSREEFLTFLDSNILPEVLEKYSPKNDKSYSHEELYHLQERARVETIKTFYSSTHEWVKVAVVQPKSFIKDYFICKRCNIRAQVFDFISHLEIIQPVRDGLPSYDAHNEYLMYDCDEIVRWNDKEEAIEAECARDYKAVICEDCGLNEQLCTTWLANEAAELLSKEDLEAAMEEENDNKYNMED